MAVSDSFNSLFCTLCFYHLYESKLQIERGRLVQLAVNSRDTLYCWKVKRFAQIGSVRLLTWGLKIKVVNIL